MHFEFVTPDSTVTVLMALRRFVSNRGIYSIKYFDRYIAAPVLLVQPIFLKHRIGITYRSMNKSIQINENLTHRLLQDRGWVVREDQQTVADNEVIINS